MPFLDQRLVTWWVNYGRAQLRRDNSNSSRFHFPYSQNHQVRKRRTIKTGLVRHYFYHRSEKGRVYAPWANHLARKNMHLTPHTHTPSASWLRSIPLTASEKIPQGHTRSGHASAAAVQPKPVFLTGARAHDKPVPVLPGSACSIAFGFTNTPQHT